MSVFSRVRGQIKFVPIARSTILVFIAFVLTFTLAMPNQVMALGIFDQKPQPAVLPAQKVETAKDQAAGSNAGAGSAAPTENKPDRTRAYEITSKRTAFTSTYMNKDGTKTLRYSPFQQNYKDGDSWKKIDNTIKPVEQPAAERSWLDVLLNTQPESDPPSEFKGKAGKISASMKPLSDGLTITAEGKTITIKPVGARDVTPERKDDHTVVYKDAWPHVDLEYQLRGEMVKEVITVKNKAAQATFNFNVTGGKVIQHPTRVGELAIEGMPDEFSFSSLTLDVNERGVISEQRVTQTPTDKGIKVQMDEAWMHAQPDNAFPMRIDPSFWKNMDTWWMYKSDGYSCNGSNCHANIGTLYDNGWKSWRTYTQFTYNELAGKKVLYANMYGQFQPDANGITDGRWINMGHANCLGYHCTGGFVGNTHAGTDFNINFTTALQNAVNANNFSAVWSFWGEEGAYKSFKPYYDMYADVVYDTATPQAPQLEPADGQVVVNAQPTLRASPVTDPDNEAVQYQFRVSTQSNGGGAVVASEWSAATQWTVPDGVLQDGTTYYWRVDTKGATITVGNTRSLKVDFRTGKDSTQAYDTVGPMGIDLATGNATTGNGTHTMNALGGKIGLNFNYDSPTMAKRGLIGEYWNLPANYDFAQGVPSGNPQLVRNDQDVNFGWPTGSSPASGIINHDWFYVRWKGYFVAPTTGSYSFGSTQDDAMSINVNGQTFHGCYGSAPCYNGGSINLQAGQAVPITINFEEAVNDGYARLYVKGAVPEQTVPNEWLRTEVQASAAQYGLAGRYYTDDGSHNFPTDTNDPNRFIMARGDSKLAFDWKDGGVAPGLPADNFMARWTGYITVPTTGDYTFGKFSDDGVRIKLNNGLLGTQQTVFDSWNYTYGEMWGSPTHLIAGQQIPITVEYYEQTYGAYFFMKMKGPGLQTEGEEVPVKWLTPKAAALPDAWKLGVDVDGNVGYERLRVAGDNVILEDSTRATHEYKWTGSGYKPPVNEDGQLTRNSDNTFTLLDSDGRTYVFDVEGKLKSLTSPTDDRNPANLKYEYAGDPSRLIKITDGVTDSRFGTLHYKGYNEEGNCSVPGGFDAAPDGMLCAFKTSDGDITKLYYKAGQLSRVEKPGSDLTDYGYDSLGRVTTIRDSIANDAIMASVRADDSTVLTELSYDSLGRANKVKTPAPQASSNRIEHTLDYKAAKTQAVYRHWLQPDSLASSQAVVPGYGLAERHGYALTSQEPGTHPLYSCKYNWDQFVTLDPNCEGSPKLGIIGYAYDAPPVGKPYTVLQRCVFFTTNDHFTWSDTGCDTRHSEGTLGYLLTNPEYAGATEMHITGAPEPNGFSKRVEYDALLRTTKETDVANLSGNTEWDPVKDLELSKTDATGLKSTTIYDDDDRPVESYGPAPAAWYGTDRKPTATYASQVPKTSAGYDEGIVGPDVTYYNYKADNKTLVGAPKLRSNGFTDSSGTTTTPGLLEKVWGADKPITPDSGMNGWGLRATGKLRVPATGTYSFHLWHDDGLRVYVDDTLLIEDWHNGNNRRAEASRTFEAGKVYRIMIEYYDADNYGALGLYMSAPNVQPVDGDKDWSAELKPGYNLTTSQTAYDSQLGDVTTKTSYSKPEYGLATTTTADPSGLNLQATATFETPGSGFLRQTGRTLPGGTSTLYSYYGANDSVDNPCTAENDPIVQAGATKGKTETDPDGSGPKQPRTTEAVYDDSGRVVATRFNNDPWTCLSYDNRGRQTGSVQPTVNGRPSRTISTQYAADGNPLKTRTIDSVAGTTESIIDLLGRTVSTKDVWGNDYALTYDNYGNVTQKTGPLGTETYTYDTFFRLTSYALNATTYATITYDNFGRVATATYPQAKDTANNTLKLTQVKRDSVGRSAGVIYQTSDGKTFDETVVRSQLGKVMNATQAYDNQTLNSNFTYDTVGRLTSGTVGQTKFDYGYNAPDSTTCSANSANNAQSNRNSNRTSYKVTNTAMSAVISNENMCYNYADQLTYSTDVNIGTPTYDDHGNTTTFSGNGTPLTFGYDANDNNIFVTQGTKRTEYVKAATGDVLRKKEFDSGQLTSSYRYVAGGAILQACSLTDDNNCTTLDRYLTLPGNVSLTLSPTNPDTTMRVVYSLRNYHGDTVLTLTTEGKTTPTTNTLLAYGPFGEQLIQGTQGTTTVNSLNATDKTMGWAADPARKQDGRYTTAFIQMGARVYIPSLGRFLQVDPVDGGTLNGYVYVADPINSSDYNGRWGVGNLFSAAVNIVKAVVKAIANPVAAIARAVAGLKTISSGGGGRTGGSRATASSGGGRVERPVTATRASFTSPSVLLGPNGSDAFYSNGTKPGGGSSGDSNRRFDYINAVSTGAGWVSVGIFVVGVVGCGIGAVATAGAAATACIVYGGAAIYSGAGLAGGAIGGAIGFVVGGNNSPAAGTFDGWYSDDFLGPWKR